MHWLIPNNKANALQEKIQQLLDKESDGGSNFRLDVDKKTMRQIIGLSFVEEPGLKWGMSHLDRSQVLKTQEELVHFSRFANSLALLEDLDAPLNFQLCQVNPNTDDQEVVSCASLQACKSAKPRGPMWLRRLQSSWKMTIQTIRILYGFGDNLPTVFHSSYMPRLEAKMQPFIENADEWHFEYGPSCQHWYLHLIGVNPTYNGLGKGKIIMNKICSLADELDKDIYLEACGKKLKGYYEQFGFAVRAVKTLMDPEDDASTLDIHLMVRCASKQRDLGV